MSRDDRSRPGKAASAGSWTDADILAEQDDITSACEAYVVLVVTPKAKYRRRVFLSLYGATEAVGRARKNGQVARMVLCHLTPVAADLDLGGWSS